MDERKMKVALGVEYNGREFSGWQTQPGRPSVQESLERAVSLVANEEVGVVCAGRTDAGVHAGEQVVHFETSAQREDHAWRMGSNCRLPGSIRILWARRVPDEFHARYSAIARYYHYVILNRSTRSAHFNDLVTWCYKPLDVQRMSEASRCLIGDHDFTSFRAKSCQSRSPCRRLYQIAVRKDDDRVLVDVVGNAFLHHMIRNIVGVLMEIGTGKKAIAWSKEVLMARDRKAGGITAAPEGLYLAGIYYPEIFAIPRHPIFDILPSGIKRFEGQKDERC